MAKTGRRSKGSTGDLSEYRRKRDFSRTSEPAGSPEPGTHGKLRFVVQKHAASQLHFDLRLELDGVMKSWAVPKGPSSDPSVKRLAMEVEDHPIEYNSFEGTIPSGEYGGGTVMLWDRGTYAADRSGDSDADAVRAGYEKGDIKITFFGERLRGSYALVRMKGTQSGRDSGKPQWLLIKHRDEHASEEDLVQQYVTSVETERTMEEITGGETAVWHSNRPASSKPKSVPSESAGRTAIPLLEPMYASIGSAVPGDGWTFEPKYDGVRVLAFVTAEEVRLITRNGLDKAMQFPEITESLRDHARKKKQSFVLDGEVVAIAGGKPARFQELQGRMHVREKQLIERYRTTSPVELVLFDILMSGERILIHEPWSVRRTELVRQFGKSPPRSVWVTESAEGDGGKMLRDARKAGWEGIIAKRITAPYEPGVRSRSWLKLKVEFRQEFVVGGYTEPRNSRQHIGALLLGYFDQDRFLYVGHTGGGFTGRELERVFRLLQPLERTSSPFEEVPRTNETAHWVEPKVVVEVKFSEFTADGKLRQPIYLGTREDKNAREVGLEKQSVQKKTGTASTRTGTTRGAERSRARRRIHAAQTPLGEESALPATRGKPGRSKRPRAASVIAQLREIEASGGSGLVDMGTGIRLSVTNLDKIFFPAKKLTKGDLMRYYAEVAHSVLPVMADRPLVLKRFPNGVEADSFFQQNAGQNTPEGVRVESIRTEGGSTNLRIVGGDLTTLLYTVQLGAISVDPWHSRVQSLDFADYTILDLDPGPRATFRRVVEVALLVKEAMDRLGVHGGLKTSGSRGLHVYLPLPAKTPNEAATLVAQIIATRVAEEHPKIATIERAVKARPATSVYVDYLQNIIGKTVAAAYSVRARVDATVSTPLEWHELSPELDPRDFTIETAVSRFRERGDLWTKALRKKNSLKALV